MTVPYELNEADLHAYVDGELDIDEFCSRIVDKVDAAYSVKERNEDRESLRRLERHIMLNAIDSLYQEHLYAMDALRQGVQLRAYGQRDPLVEFKQEAYEMFAELMDTIKDQILSNMFRSATTLSAFRQMLDSLPHEEVHAQLAQFGGVASGGGSGGAGAGGDEQPVMPAAAATRRLRSSPKSARKRKSQVLSGKKARRSFSSTPA